MAKTEHPDRVLRQIARAGFARLLLAEVSRFVSARSRTSALAAAAGGLVLVSLASAMVSHQSGPGVAAGPDGHAVADTYMFVHRGLTGDGVITTEVAAFAGVHAAGNGTQGPATGGAAPPLQPGLVSWAKAGIVVEPDTRQGTAYAAVMVTGSHGVQMQDNYSEHRSGLPGAVESSSPRWLRLTRTDGLITAFDSTDGTHWATIGTVRLVSLPRTVQIGLFVTSPQYFAAGASTGGPSVATADFARLSTQGNLTDRAWTGSPIVGLYPGLASDLTWRQTSADAFTISGSGDIAPLVVGTVFTHRSGAAIVNGTVVALVVTIVVAASFATSPYRRRELPRASPATPCRVLAQAGAAGSVTFLAGAVATALADIVSRQVLAANGNYLDPQSAAVLARVSLGTGLLLGLAAALSVALAAMLRRSATTILAAMLLIVVPGVVATSVPAVAVDWLLRATPTAAFAIQATLPRSHLVDGGYTPYNGYFPISPWGGIAVLVAYTTTALTIAIFAARRRTRETTPA
jgi:hypothetical protein